MILAVDRQLERSHHGPHAYSDEAVMEVPGMSQREVIDWRECAKALEEFSPAVGLVRSLGHGGIQIHVVATPTFVARTVKVSDHRYEVTVSVGAWLATHYLLSQEHAEYESNGDPLNRTADTIAWFSDHGFFRVAALDDVARDGWHWSSLPLQPAQAAHERFHDLYFRPWLSGQPVDRRVELALAFIALHELWHILQDHFRDYPHADPLRAQKLELLADLRASGMFPSLVTDLAESFGIAGRERCNVLIASGFSIGCALLCFQGLQRLSPSPGPHPPPFWRFGVLILAIAGDATNRPIANDDRDSLVAGMYLVLRSFGKVEARSLESEGALQAAMGIPELENYLTAHPSQFALWLTEQLPEAAPPAPVGAAAFRAMQWMGAIGARLGL